MNDLSYFFGPSLIEPRVRVGREFFIYIFVCGCIDEISVSLYPLAYCGGGVFVVVIPKNFVFGDSALC